MGGIIHGVFLTALNEQLKDGLAIRDVTLDLKSLISSSSVRTKGETRTSSRCTDFFFLPPTSVTQIEVTVSECSPPSKEPGEPMQLGQAQLLSSGEAEEADFEGVYLQWPSCSMQAGALTSCHSSCSMAARLILSGTLYWQDDSLFLSFQVDSGADGCFIDQEVV